jgi:hypothetical protein
VKRHRLIETLRAAGRVEATIDDSTWIIDRGRLIDAVRAGAASRRLPVVPPEAVPLGSPLPREAVDETLVLARFFEKHADDVVVRCTGDWDFPVAAPDRVPKLPRRDSTMPRAS